MNLVVNPFTKYDHFSEENAEFVIISPKPHEGLKTVKISNAAFPNLFDLCTTVQPPFWDVEKDLDDSERELLIANGILLDAENLPQKPLFACQLDDVEIKKLSSNTTLFVNPTLRYEPLNIANFATWTHEKHLLPQQNTVWIKSPVTNIEIGYWLTNNQAEIIKNLVANEQFTAKVDDETLSKLIASEILVSNETLQKRTIELREICEQNRIKFAEKKYCVIENLLPQTHVRAMQTFYRQYVASGFMPFGDPQVPNRFVQHNEPLAKQMHENLTDLMSLIVGNEVIPSYVYAASYKNSADLMPHVDREQCEYSISFQVDYTPENSDKISPWSLYVEPAGEKNFGWEIVAKEGEFDEKRTAVNLANGDGLFYKGRELVHYRYALPQNHTSTSLFFHYVDKDFKGELR